jgi:hypothetical protein
MSIASRGPVQWWWLCAKQRQDAAFVDLEDTVVSILAVHVADAIDRQRVNGA